MMIDDATSITSPSRHPLPCNASSLASLCRGCRSQRLRPRRNPVPRRRPARSIPRIRPTERAGDEGVVHLRLCGTTTTAPRRGAPPRHRRYSSRRRRRPPRCWRGLTWRPPNVDAVSVVVSRFARRRPPSYRRAPRETHRSPPPSYPLRAARPILVRTSHVPLTLPIVVVRCVRVRRQLIVESRHRDLPHSKKKPSLTCCIESIVVKGVSVW